MEDAERVVYRIFPALCVRERLHVFHLALALVFGKKLAQLGQVHDLHGALLQEVIDELCWPLASGVDPDVTICRLENG